VSVHCTVHWIDLVHVCEDLPPWVRGASPEARCEHERL
jgi:hypothetical protein